jgi:hypothetical protein
MKYTLTTEELAQYPRIKAVFDNMHDYEFSNVTFTDKAPGPLKNEIMRMVLELQIHSIITPEYPPSFLLAHGTKQITFNFS